MMNPPIGQTVPVYQGKYAGERGIVERYTDKQVYVRLIQRNTTVRISQKSLCPPPPEPNHVVASTGERLFLGQEVEVHRGKYNGNRGTIKRFTPQKVYVHLTSAGYEVCINQSSVRQSSLPTTRRQSTTSWNYQSSPIRNSPMTSPSDFSVPQNLTPASSVREQVPRVVTPTPNVDTFAYHGHSNMVTSRAPTLTTPQPASERLFSLQPRVLAQSVTSSRNEQVSFTQNQTSNNVSVSRIRVVTPPPQERNRNAQMHNNNRRNSDTSGGFRLPMHSSQTQVRVPTLARTTSNPNPSQTLHNNNSSNSDVGGAIRLPSLSSRTQAQLPTLVRTGLNQNPSQTSRSNAQFQSRRLLSFDTNNHVSVSMQTRRATREHIIECLPVSIVQDPAVLSENCRTCAICQDDFASGDRMKRLPCFHCFHENCIDSWIRRNPTCPLCCRRLTEDLALA